MNHAPVIVSCSRWLLLAALGVDTVERQVGVEDARDVERVVNALALRRPPLDVVGPKH